MMLDYEWGNPAAAAAAMLLFGEDAGQIDNGHNQHQHQHQHQQIFDHYGHGLGLGMDFFQQAQPQQMPSPAALFTASTTSTTSTCHQRFGLALPPAPARIGLNLGGRTYFSSASPEQEMMMIAAGGRVTRRRTRTARCQAEGCGVDLSHAKHYHRRHKVCEFHSKASIVIAAGLSQRFCQQCSRFHVLSEFDQGKRSCRKRLADHNRRRRKSQELSTTASSALINTNNNSSMIKTITNAPPNPDYSISTAAIKPDTCSSVTQVSSPPLVLQASVANPSPPMTLGLSMQSASSSTGTTSPPQSLSFLSQLGDYRGQEHRPFPSWDEAEDGSSIRGLYDENK